MIRHANEDDPMRVEREGEGEGTIPIELHSLSGTTCGERFMLSEIAARTRYLPSVRVKRQWISVDRVAIFLYVVQGGTPPL